MQRNRAVATPLIATQPGSTGRISSRPAGHILIRMEIHTNPVIRVIYQPFLSLCLNCFTYCTEFGPQSHGSVHHHWSAGEALAWQRTGVWVGPPGPSLGGCGVPGPIGVKNPLQQQKAHWQRIQWPQAEAWFTKSSSCTVLPLPPAGRVKYGSLILTLPFKHGPYQFQITLFPKSSSQKQTTTHPCMTSNWIRALHWRDEPCTLHSKLNQFFLYKIGWFFLTDYVYFRIQTTYTV